MPCAADKWNRLVKRQENMDPRSALQQYNQVRTHAQVEDASPHRLIQLLMEGALDKIKLAKGYMEHQKIPEKVRHINWALSIVDGLQNSLDMEKGGDIAQHLDALYDYIQRRLILANLDNDPALLDEAAGLLLEIKSAWDAVPQILKSDERKMAPAGAVTPCPLPWQARIKLVNCWSSAAACCRPPRNRSGNRCRSSRARVRDCWPVMMLAPTSHWGGNGWK